jgi:hypothetical protein
MIRTAAEFGVRDGFSQVLDRFIGRIGEQQ